MAPSLSGERVRKALGPGTMGCCAGLQVYNIGTTHERSTIEVAADICKA